MPPESGSSIRSSALWMGLCPDPNDTGNAAASLRLPISFRMNGRRGGAFRTGGHGREQGTSRSRVPCPVAPRCRLYPKIVHPQFQTFVEHSNNPVSNSSRTVRWILPNLHVKSRLKFTGTALGPGIPSAARTPMSEKEHRHGIPEGYGI